jgi:hypothetical protein
MSIVSLASIISPFRFRIEKFSPFNFHLSPYLPRLLSPSVCLDLLTLPPPSAVIKSVFPLQPKPLLHLPHAPPSFLSSPQRGLSASPALHLHLAPEKNSEKKTQRAAIPRAAAIFTGGALGALSLPVLCEASTAASITTVAGYAMSPLTLSVLSTAGPAAFFVLQAAR